MKVELERDMVELTVEMLRAHTKEGSILIKYWEEILESGN